MELYIFFKFTAVEDNYVTLRITTCCQQRWTLVAQCDKPAMVELTWQWQHLERFMCRGAKARLQLS